MSGTCWDGGRLQSPGIIPKPGHGAGWDHLGMAPGAAPSIFLRIPGSLVWGFAWELQEIKLGVSAVPWAAENTASH